MSLLKKEYWQQSFAETTDRETSCEFLFIGVDSLCLLVVILISISCLFYFLIAYPQIFQLS